MVFTFPLFGKILKRYKRFFVDVELEDGSIITAHCPNTGSMKTCIGQDYTCVLSKNADPKRKLKFTLEMTFNGETWIGVNTHIPNKIVRDAISNGEIAELSGYSRIIPEFKVGDSRIDLCLSSGESKCFVEIKNVTLKNDNFEALFPDAVTTRGKKHLQELISLKQAGFRSCIFFLVQREDVQIFKPAINIDPCYCQTLEEAHNMGVEIIVYQTMLSPSEIKIKKRLPFILRG